MTAPDCARPRLHCAWGAVVTLLVVDPAPPRPNPSVGGFGGAQSTRGDAAQRNKINNERLRPRS